MTFSDLYIQRVFNPQELAALADVPMEVIDRLLLDQRVSQELVEKVLSALSQQSEQRYTLETVRVNLSKSKTVKGGTPQ